MRLKINKSQWGIIERGMIEQEEPAIARRLREDFPETTSRMTQDELRVFVHACAEQVLALGTLDDVEQVYRLAAVNVNMARILASPVGGPYFARVAGSPDLEGGRKIDLLHRNLSRYFEAAREMR